MFFVAELQSLLVFWQDRPIFPHSKIVIPSENNVINDLMIHVFCTSFSDWEAVVKLSDDFNGADLRNVCTEAGE